MRILPLIAVLLLMIGACNPEDDDPIVPKPTTGEIFVRATENGNPLPEVTITTDPVTVSMVTDATGTVLLAGVPAGTYRVLASKAGYGSVAASTSVKAEMVASVELSLRSGGSPGNNFDIPPTISLYLDANEIYSGDNIRISGSVYDDLDGASTLPIVISSSLDGVLDTLFANSSGSFTYETSVLSTGNHTITAVATDGAGLSSSVQLSFEVLALPQAIVIDTIIPVAGGVQLIWSGIQLENYASYVIEKSVGDPDGSYTEIASIHTSEQASYTDNSITIGRTVYYRVSVRLGYYDGRLVAGQPRAYALDLPGIALNTGIVRMKADRERPYIYGVDRVNNRLLFINTKSLEVEQSIFVGSAPVDMTFSRDNSKLYVANYGSSLIAIVDLDSRKKTGDLSVNTQGNWDGNPYRIAAMADNRLVFTSEDQWNDLKLIDASSGTQLYNTGSVYRPGLSVNKEGTVLYVSESGSTGSSVIRFNLQGDELVQVSESQSDTNFGNRDATLTTNGEFIYYSNHKLLANNLQTVLGTFPEAIVSATSDGKIAIGTTAIYDGETFGLLRGLPVTSEIATVSHDDQTLYVYDQNSSYLIFIDLKDL